MTAFNWSKNAMSTVNWKKHADAISRAANRLDREAERALATIKNDEDANEQCEMLRQDARDLRRVASLVGQGTLTKVGVALDRLDDMDTDAREQVPLRTYTVMVNAVHYGIGR